MEMEHSITEYGKKKKEDIHDTWFHFNGQKYLLNALLHSKYIFRIFENVLHFRTPAFCSGVPGGSIL